MDPFKITTIAHEKLTFCSPISGDDVAAMVAKIGLDNEAFVLDLGCGKGEVLRRIVARYPNVRAHGIDLNPAFIEQAEARARKLPGSAHVTFEVGDVKKMTVHAGSLNMVICIGSTHLFGTFAQALRSFNTMLRAGGIALVGHGYWKRRPDPVYLKHFFNSSESDFNDNAGNLKAALACGFNPMAAAVAGDVDWAAYERTWGETLMEYVALHPADADAQPLLQRAYKSRDNYFVHGGREILGFGLYLLKKR